MRTSKQSIFAIVAVVMLLVIAGTYLLLRPPAPKLLPEEVLPPSEPKAAPQGIPGVPPFDRNKYTAEPVITVYLADKGYVESMPLEKYLEGVVAQEVDPTWPVNALAAQAIASRTLTLSAIEAGTIKKLHQADVSTNKEELQAYAPQKINDAVRQAVSKTRGQVLLYGDTLVNAIYSSCNGQIAATKEEAFPTEIVVPTPYFQPVEDTCFQYAPVKEQAWTAKIPASEVASAIGYQGNAADIKILEKGPSGRILWIGAGDKKIYGSDFRRKIGYDRMRSTLITDMVYEGGNFVFKGLGWGNGVGLCQWGAYTYAQQGWTEDAILKHYYIDVDIVRLWQ